LVPPVDVTDVSPVKLPPLTRLALAPMLKPPPPVLLIVTSRMLSDPAALPEMAKLPLVWPMVKPASVLADARVIVGTLAPAAVRGRDRVAAVDGDAAGGGQRVAVLDQRPTVQRVVAGHAVQAVGGAVRADRRRRQRHVADRLIGIVEGKRRDHDRARHQGRT